MSRLRVWHTPGYFWSLKDEILVQGRASDEGRWVEVYSNQAIEPLTVPSARVAKTILSFLAHKYPSVWIREIRLSESETRIVDMAIERSLESSSFTRPTVVRDAAGKRRWRRVDEELMQLDATKMPWDVVVLKPDGSEYTVECTEDAEIVTLFAYDRIKPYTSKFMLSEHELHLLSELLISSSDFCFM